MLPNRYPQLPFWLAVAAVMVGLTVPVLIQDGMFMDAMLYTSVAHNLSLGYGTFWFPQFSLHNVAGLAAFHEQPPLVFGIEALFFKLLGSSMYTERLYTFGTMLATAALMVQLWRESIGTVAHTTTTARIAWLPLLLWITIPTAFWSYSNNMQENTMGVFTLVAVGCGFRGLRTMFAERFWRGVAWVVVSGVFVFLATLSKGFPGFFPVMLPAVYLLTLAPESLRSVVGWVRGVVSTTVLVATPLVGYAVLYLFDESRASLHTYLFKRALHRINEAPTVSSHFSILGNLALDLLPAAVVVAAVWWSRGTKGSAKPDASAKSFLRLGIFWIMVGASASLPLMLTLVQRGFYYVPSLPMFGLGFGLLVAPTVANWVSAIFSGTHAARHYRVALVGGALLLCFAIGFSVSKVGRSSRDETTLHDVHAIGRAIPSGAIIAIPQAMWDDWSLQCYLMRYDRIALDNDSLALPHRRFYLLDTAHLHLVPPTNYKPYPTANLHTQQYQLFERSAE